MDKDPAKRWSCDKLIKHSYFDDYIAKQREFETMNILEATTLRQQQLLQQHMIQQQHLQQHQQQQQHATQQQSILQTSTAAAVANRDKSKVHN